MLCPCVVGGGRATEEQTPSIKCFYKLGGDLIHEGEAFVA